MANKTVALKQDAPTGADSLLALVERAASDPSVDVDKMDRLLSMYERMQAERARLAYVDVMAAMQPELPEIPERGAIRNRQGQVQSHYALWEDIVSEIKPILARYGFALSFRVEQTADAITVTGVLSHVEGHTESTSISLPADTTGSKNAVQAVASSISYGQRYAATALLNLTSRGEDDDGQAAGRGETVTEQQALDLRAMADEVGADHAQFLKFLGVADYESIPASQYKRAIAALEKKRSAA